MTIYPYYQFKPNGHWNYIPESVYVELKRFFGAEHLRIGYVDSTFGY